jgi:hypothetical protein
MKLDLQANRTQSPFWGQTTRWANLGARTTLANLGRKRKILIQINFYEKSKSKKKFSEKSTVG